MTQPKWFPLTVKADKLSASTVTITVPTDRIFHIYRVYTNYVCNATVGNRKIYIETKDIDNLQTFIDTAPIFQTVSQNRRYVWAVNGLNEYSFDTGVTPQLMRLAIGGGPIILGPGAKIKFGDANDITSGGASGENIFFRVTGIQQLANDINGGYPVSSPLTNVTQIITA